MQQSPSKVAKDVVEWFRVGGKPKYVKFNLADLEWVKDQAKEEFIHMSLPYAFDEPGAGTLNQNDLKILLIVEATMRWMHKADLVNDGAAATFSRKFPDSLPPVDEVEWIQEPKKD